MEKEVENVVNKLGLNKDLSKIDEYYLGDYTFKITIFDPSLFPIVYVKKNNMYARISFGILKNLKKESIFDMLDYEFNK